MDDKITRIDSGENLLGFSFGSDGGGDAIWAEIKETPEDTLVCVHRELIPPKGTQSTPAEIPAEPECVEIR